MKFFKTEICWFTALASFALTVLFDQYNFVRWPYCRVLHIKLQCNTYKREQFADTLPV